MKCDFLVIGSGIAGLSFASRVSTLGSVCIVTKKKDVDCATNLAQGGIAAVLDEKDSFVSHIQDTLASGAGLCDSLTVEKIVEEGPARIEDLITAGVRFVRQQGDEGRLNLGREGGHSCRRVAHAYDLTGREIERALLEQVKEKKNITFLENAICVDLIVNENDAVSSRVEKRCVGAYLLIDGQVEVVEAGLTVLCTGGTGKVYLYTSNPDISTGDGIAMAFRIGAEVTNMEFVQFHPTCLYHPEAKNFLITEAVRGEGGVLLNKKGERFLEKFEPDKMELATRDRIARAIDKEMKTTGCDCVYLDISHKDPEFIKKRFPGVYAKCLEYGIDITDKPIPVVPAAHYMCGGVITDYWGRTNVDGLMALGETACTGLHGANRLASNSLLEAVVYADRAARYCRENREYWHKMDTVQLPQWVDSKTIMLDEEILINHNWDLIRRYMWNYVGIVRNRTRLDLAAERLAGIIREVEQHYIRYRVTQPMIELRNIAIIANLIVECARNRNESRGLHFLEGADAEVAGERKWNVFVRKRSDVQVPWQAEKVREVRVG